MSCKWLALPEDHYHSFGLLLDLVPAAVHNTPHITVSSCFTYALCLCLCLLPVRISSWHQALYTGGVAKLYIEMLPQLLLMRCIVTKDTKGSPVSQQIYFHFLSIWVKKKIFYPWPECHDEEGSIWIQHAKLHPVLCMHFHVYLFILCRWNSCL